MKFAIINRIGAFNWAPINHSSIISTTLAKLVFVIGIKQNLNFRESVFDHTMKHVTTFVVKLPYSFSLLDD